MQRILISTIGSRGDVQPILALARELVLLDKQVEMCVPPNFKDWVTSFGIKCFTFGQDVQNSPRNNSNPDKKRQKRKKLSASDTKKMLQNLVVEQFELMTNITSEYDLIIGAGDLSLSARSIAESRNIPYIHVRYCPVAFISSEHSPPMLKEINKMQNLPRLFNKILWLYGRFYSNNIYRAVLNVQRDKLNLTPVKDVMRYLETDRSWLAADSVIAPAPLDCSTPIFQSGAWILQDDNPLPEALEKFLASGPPPIYFGFGSMGTRKDVVDIFIEAARAVNRRVIVSKGWAKLSLDDERDDYIVIDEVNHDLLLPRVASVIHHGGAGTTTTAARSGAPQVVVPHIYDQFYWANRVERLGVGVSVGKVRDLTVNKLVGALRLCLDSGMVDRATSLAGRIKADGAKMAAEKIVNEIL